MNQSNSASTSTRTPSSEFVFCSLTVCPYELCVLQVLYYGAVATNGFKLTCRMGWIFIGTYGVYALYSIFLVWLMDVYDLQEGSTI